MEGSQSIQKIINKIIKSKIFEIEFRSISKLFEGVLVLKYFYFNCSDAANIKSQFQKDKLVKVFSSTYMITAIEGDTICFMICDIEEGLKEIFYFLEQNIKKEICEDLDIRLKTVKYEVSRFLKDRTKVLKEISQKYPKINPTSYGLELFLNIIPKQYVYGKPPTLHKLPRGIAENISKVCIYTDCCSHIKAVQINGVHPNAKDGWFCIGKIEGRKLSVAALDCIVTIIKTYNLIDCYYVPKELKQNLTQT